MSGCAAVAALMETLQTVVFTHMALVPKKHNWTFYPQVSSKLLPSQGIQWCTISLFLFWSWFHCQLCLDTWYSCGFIVQDEIVGWQSTFFWKPGFHKIIQSRPSFQLPFHIVKHPAAYHNRMQRSWNHELQQEGDKPVLPCIWDWFSSR